MKARLRGIVGALGVLGVLASLQGTARADGHTPSPVREILAEERYRFCHEADYPLTTEEHAWCPLVGESSEACPTLPKACTLPPIEGSTARGTLPLGRGRGRGGRGRARKNADGDARKREDPNHRRDDRPQDDPRSRPEPERQPISLPDLSGVAQILLLGLIVAFVVVLVRSILKNFVRDRSGDGAADEASPGAEATPDDAPVRGPIETDVERLLGRARAAAARGDYARAIDDTYAALLRRLDGDGLIDIHPSRTNGDYVRQLRDRPELKSTVRDIVGDVERVQFGATAPSERAFRAVIDRVAPLVGRALGVALLCFGLGAAISCTPGDDDGEGEGSDFHAETSPSGTQAIVAMLAKQSIKATHRSEALSLVEKPDVVVLLPGAQPDEATWKHLLAWVHDKGGRLVIAGPETLPAELGLRIVPGGDFEGVDFEGPFASRFAGLTPRLPPGLRLEPTDPQQDAVEGAFLDHGPALYAVRRPSGTGEVVVFADDAFFSNIALTVGDNAAFLGRFFGSQSPPTDVELCDGWTGAGAATPLESVQRAELTPVIVQLLVLLTLLYLWKGRAFARLRDPPAETRRAFADHARALGLAYGRARASRHVLGLYAVWALERLRERVHRSGRQGLIPLAEAIAARTGRPEAEIMRVLVEASGARDEAAPPSSFRDRGPPVKKAKRDETEADLVLMRELSGFLSATGQRRPARRSLRSTKDA